MRCKVHNKTFPETGLMYLIARLNLLYRTILLANVSCYNKSMSRLHIGCSYMNCVCGKWFTIYYKSI